MKHIKITKNTKLKGYYARHGIINFERGMKKIKPDDYAINEGKEAIQYFLAIYTNYDNEGWTPQGKHSYIIFKKRK